MTNVVFSIISFTWQHIKYYKCAYFLMIVAPIVSSFYPFINNYSIKVFVDILSNSPKAEYYSFIWPLGLLLSTEVILSILWQISHYMSSKIEPLVRQRIILYSYDYVQHLDYAFFQDNFLASITSKINGILDGYNRLFYEIRCGLLRRCLKIIINIIAILWINFFIGILVIIWCILFILVIYPLSSRLNLFYSIEAKSQYSIISFISDKILNIFSVTAFVNREHEYNNLSTQISKSYIPKQVKASLYHAKIQLIVAIFYFCIIACTSFTLIFLKREGLIGVGSFIFIFTSILSIMDEIWHATISMQDFTRAIAKFNISLSILSTPQNNKDHFESTNLHLEYPKIEFKNVSFYYPNQKYLFNNFNLKIRPGEKIGLIGRSGSGKSSLINLLLKHFTIQKGIITISDQNIANLTQDSIRKAIGIIPQDITLFHSSVIENIRYGNILASNEEVFIAAKKAHIHEYILTLPHGYNTFVGERGVKLSGGQRQRIAIARAFLKNPQILILDEATSFLDTGTEKQIQESLNLLIKDQRRTVIAIAHRFSTLECMDRIITIDNGQIIKTERYKDY